MHTYITLMIGGNLLRGFAVWALVKEQAVTSSTKTLLPPLITMTLFGAVLYGLVVNNWTPFPVYYDWILPTLIVPALAVVLTYAVRDRGSGEPQPSLELQST